jgi:glutamyl-tRNA synthetase
MGWDVPVWAHIPLIHGPDGKKLSKRHGAPGSRNIRRWAIRRQGCATTSPGWAGAMATPSSSPMRRRARGFDLEGIGNSPARFDFKKLENLSGQHIAPPTTRAAARAGGFLAATGQRP